MINPQTQTTTFDENVSFTAVNVAVELKNSQSQKYPYFQRLADEAAKKLKTNLERELGISPANHDVTHHHVLQVVITKCDPGSRFGRFCCAEFGVGWATLEINWKVEENFNTILLHGKKKYQTSGKVGFDDIFKEDVGEQFIFATVSWDALHDILRAVRK